LGRKACAIAFLRTAIWVGAAVAALLWLLPHPWTWLGLFIFVVMTVVKIVWSARLEKSSLKPVTKVVLIGYALGIIVGAFLFVFLS